jgi:hypothetical protein
MKRMYFARDGRAITQDQWVAYEQDEKYRRIALTDVGRRGHVSTIWLGIDYSWGLGRPVFFETLIRDSPMGEHILRYSTLRDARRGHRLAVKLLRTAKPPAPLFHNGGRPKKSSK